MSDWMRTPNILGLLIFGLACLAWGAGGWLAARSWFRLERGRLLIGAAAGFVCELTLINLLTPLLGLPAASLVSAGIILAAGLTAAWRRRVPWPELRADLQDWPQLALLLVITLIFERSLRGVSLFDEYMHIPLVSIMGTGSIPPHFYLNPNLMFAYHYGLQIFSAALESGAGFYPWSAWDMARGLALAWTLGLGWMWVRRFGGKGAGLAAALGALLFVFGGGTRWLLLFLPAGLLNWVSQGVQLSNTGAASGATLSEALSHTLLMEGSGPVAFPFAFHNGVFIPWSFTLGSTGALPPLTLLLLLLLARPFPSLRSPGSLVALSLLLANLALSAEHLFAFVWIGIFLTGLAAVLVSWRKRRPVPKEQLWGWASILAASALLSAFQGGFVTETLRVAFLNWQGKNETASNLYGFALRWPPAIVSAHMNTLSPFNLRQLVALLAEAGPALLAAPWATWWAWRAARRGDWLTAGIGLAGLLMTLFTLFVEYGVDRSSTRFAGSSLWIWLVLAYPLALWLYRKARPVGQAALGVLFGAVLWAGLVIFAIQATAIPKPVPTYFIGSELDLPMTRKYWNQLEPGAQVLDSLPERATAIFGRIGKTNSSIYVRLPEWEALMAQPGPAQAAAYGFAYVYMDEAWWKELSPEIQRAYQGPCVQLKDQMEAPGGVRFRRLYDIRACR